MGDGVVGGSDWFGHAASRRVQVFDLTKAPEPRQCFHYPIHVKPEWNLYFKEMGNGDDDENEANDEEEEGEEEEEDDDGSA